jgi:hypothetical protein
MQYPEPDDGAWPARVLRNRRLNQTPEKENTATRLRFMHQRRVVAQSPRADLCQARVSRCSEAGVLVVSSHDEVQIHSGADDADF